MNQILVSITVHSRFMGVFRGKTPFNNFTNVVYNSTVLKENYQITIIKAQSMSAEMKSGTNRVNLIRCFLILKEFRDIYATYRYQTRIVINFVYHR